MVVCSREYRGSTYLLREAVPSDCRLLYDWRMDPVTRAGSFGHDTFPYEGHYSNWYRLKLPDGQTAYVARGMAEVIGR